MLTDAAHFYQTIVIKLLSEVDLLLNQYVYNGYHALSDYLRIPLGLIATLYIALLGISVMNGWVKLSMGNFVKAVLKIGLIYTAVTEWGFVSEYLVGFINSVIGEVGDALTAASPVHIPGVDGVDGAMQLTLIEFVKLGSRLWDTGGISNLGGLFDGALVWAFGYLIVGIGLFEIILSKIMLAILFVFTPFIVIFCYFKPFQSIFDRWLGSIVGFALLQLFVTAALTLALSLAYWWLGMYTGASALQIGSVGVLPVIIIGIMCIGIIFRASQLAQNLGGMVSTAAGAAMVGGFVGGAVGSGLSSLKLGAKGVALGWKGSKAAVSLAARGMTGGFTSSDSSQSTMNAVKSNLRQGGSE